MKVVVLGTGATSGTLRTDGGVAGFIRRLTTVRPSWTCEYPLLARVVADCQEEAEQLSLEHLWTRIDYYSKFRRILGSEYGAPASIQLHKAVVDAYSFVDDVARICTTTTEFTLKRVLRGLTSGDALISFNWDTLAETILQRMLGKDVVQAPHPSGNSSIRLIKPHGSLSWVHRSGEPPLFQDGSGPRLESMTSAEVQGGPGWFVQPLVLGAVPIKSELLEEIQFRQPQLHETISDQWGQVVDVFSRVTEVEIVGYRFPQEDAYGRFLFREAVRRRPDATHLPTIRYYALVRDREEFEKAFREVFAPQVNYEYMGEVKSAWPSNAESRTTSD